MTIQRYSKEHIKLKCSNNPKEGKNGEQSNETQTQETNN